MGHNDHFEDDYPDLPDEAGTNTGSGFEPNDEWLLSAPQHLRHEAMCQWFLSRYCDPANDTPYNGREGGYLYIHGGPYEAEDELYGRFGGLFDDEVLRAVIDDVEGEGIDEWAPIHAEPDYDDYFAFEVESEDLPYKQFLRSLSEVDSLNATSLDSENKRLLRQLIYSHLIAAFETYLSDTISYWVKSDEAVFKRFVFHCSEFKQEKLPLSNIFKRLEGLREKVEQYIQKTVWHRLDRVMPLFASALDIERPKIEQLMEHIVIRHDIVHRGGRTKDGNHVEITADKLAELRELVASFVEKIEKEITPRDQELEF
jgi:hypothetical protein